MEMKFIANVLDQLDFALDHILLEDPNYKRLSLMLIDNALELALHQHALERKRELQSSGKENHPDAALIEEALGQHFDPKVKLGKKSGWLTEEVARTVNILHGYRNQLYHAGLMHESILHALAVFHLRTVCELMATTQDSSLSYGMKMKLPHRAAKYLGMPPFIGKDVHALVRAAWARLREIAEALPFDLAGQLQADIESRIAEFVKLVDYLAGAERPHKPDKSRSEVIAESQAWHVAFTEKGREFVRKHKPPYKGLDDIVNFIAKNYPFAVKSDPIPSWTKRAESIGKEKNPHKCLEKYQQLLEQMDEVHEAVEEAAGALDAHVQMQIDQMRGK
jgi:hypothetical protein